MRARAQRLADCCIWDIDFTIRIGGKVGQGAETRNI